MNRWFTALLLAHLLAVVAMAASPQLHELIHHDADHDDHECAVTLMLAGGTDTVVSPPVFDSMAIATDFSTVPIHPIIWVEHLFLARSVLEHAPPPTA